MKKIAFACCLGIIGILTTEFGVIGILPQIAAYYHISIGNAGLLLSAFALVVAIIGPFTSLLSSKFNGKKVMLVSLSLFLITGIVSSFAPPFWLLLTVRILPTLLHSAYFASAIAAVISIADKKDQHKMMSIALSGINIAMVTTIPFGTYLTSITIWQYSFVFQAAVSGLAILSTYYFMPTLPANGKENYGTQLQILRKPALWLSLAMCILMFTGEFSMYSYFAEYMLRVKSMNPKDISYLMFVFGICGLLGTWIAGKALSKSIPITTVVFLAGCNILVPLGLYFTGNSSITTIILVAAWGILYAPGVLIAMSSISSTAPEALEFANGLTASFANLGVTAGTMAGGWVILNNGIGQIPWIAICFGTASIAFVFISSFWESRVKITISGEK